MDRRSPYTFMPGNPLHAVSNAAGHALAYLERERGVAGAETAYRDPRDRRHVQAVLLVDVTRRLLDAFGRVAETSGRMAERMGRLHNTTSKAGSAAPYACAGARTIGEQGLAVALAAERVVELDAVVGAACRAWTAAQDGPPGAGRP